MWLLDSILLALSLCADCFAVTTCSSITVREITWGKIFSIAIVFGMVQTSLMVAGWMFGDIFVGLVEHVAKLIGFLLLLYVGGSMLVKSALVQEDMPMDLNGLRNVVIGAAATSIDALAVGISLSMSQPELWSLIASFVCVFIVTVISVILGMHCGKAVGARFGRVAEIIGGIVLILIGMKINI